MRALLRTPLAPIALLACLCACEGLDVATGAAYMQSRVRGDSALGDSTGGSLPPTRISQSRDLGLGDDDPAVMLFGEVSRDEWHFRGNFFTFQDRGTGVLPGPYGDLPAGSAVTADFDFVGARIDATYDVVDLDYFQLGVGGAVDYFDLDIDLDAVGLAQRESLESDVLVPMPFVRAHLTEGIVTGDVSIGGMGGDFGDGDGVWIDFESMLRVRPTSMIEFFGGYRWLRIDGDGVVDRHAYLADFEISGWFVGGAIHFSKPRREPSLF
ncbi:MAG: hypothetical protein AAF628_20290 [Planctomycetota bacterium]